MVEFVCRGIYRLSDKENFPVEHLPFSIQHISTHKERQMEGDTQCVRVFVCVGICNCVCVCERERDGA